MLFTYHQAGGDHVVKRTGTERAHALEQNWFAHDQLVSELIKDGDRPIARLRFAVWRDNRDQVAESYVAWKTWGTQFESELFDKVYSVFLDRTWARHRDAILEACTTSRSPSKRRLLFLAQIAVELAAYVSSEPGPGGEPMYEWIEIREVMD